MNRQQDGPPSFLARTRRIFKRLIVAIPLAIAAAGTMTVAEGIAKAPPAHAWGLGSITKVTDKFADAAKAVSGAIQKAQGAAKDAARRVGNDIKNTSKIVGRNAKDWGTSVGAGARDVARVATGGRRGTLRSYNNGARSATAGNHVVRGPASAKRPASATPPRRQVTRDVKRPVLKRQERRTTSTRIAVGNQGIGKKDIQIRKRIARDKSVKGRPANAGRAKKKIKRLGRDRKDKRFKKLRRTRDIKKTRDKRKRLSRGSNKKRLKKSRRDRRFKKKRSHRRSFNKGRDRRGVNRRSKPLRS